MEVCERIVSKYTLIFVCSLEVVCYLPLAECTRPRIVEMA